jgi:predicted subunit of tRNA(5-methylaminomethyl-2-thiouridylate) methyltransferase
MPIELILTGRRASPAVLTNHGKAVETVASRLLASIDPMSGSTRRGDNPLLSCITISEGESPSHVQSRL